MRASVSGVPQHENVTWTSEGVVLETRWNLDHYGHMEQKEQGCDYRTSFNFIKLFNELLRSLSAWHCVENGFERRARIGTTDDGSVRCLASLRQLLTRCLLGLGTPGTAAHEATVSVLGDEGYD